MATWTPTPATLGPLGLSAARHITAGFALTAMGMLLVAPALASPGMAAAQSLAAYGVVAFVLIAGLRDHAPWPGFGAANRLTLGRGVLASIIAAFVAQGPLSPTLLWGVVGMAAIAYLLDAVDGWRARRDGMATPFGARFDMEMDALLILVLSALVMTEGRAGPWVLAIGAMRYALLAAAWAVPALGRPLPTSNRRRFVCAAQMALLIACLTPPVPPPAAAIFAGLALTMLSASFALDVAWLIRNRKKQEGASTP